MQYNGEFKSFNGTCVRRKNMELFRWSTLFFIDLRTNFRFKYYLRFKLIPNYLKVPDFRSSAICIKLIVKSKKQYDNVN